MVRFIIPQHRLLAHENGQHMKRKPNFCNGKKKILKFKHLYKYILPLPNDVS